MKKIILLFTLVVLTLGNSFGQDAKYKASVKKLLEVQGSEAVYQSVFKQMIEMFKQKKTSVPEKFWTEMETELLAISLNDLMELIAPVYYKHLSLSDIEAMIAFYETPVGKKFAEKSPLIAQESMAAGQAWGREIGEKIVKKLEEEGY